MGTMRAVTIAIVFCLVECSAHPVRFKECKDAGGSAAACEYDLSLISRVREQSNRDHSFEELKVLAKGLAGEKVMVRTESKIASDGKLLSVTISDGSKLAELDSAIHRIINRASPFPQPPTNLVRDGSYLFRWDFVLLK